MTDYFLFKLWVKNKKLHNGIWKPRQSFHYKKGRGEGCPIACSSDVTHCLVNFSWVAPDFQSRLKDGILGRCATYGKTELYVLSFREGTWGETLKLIFKALPEFLFEMTLHVPHPSREQKILLWSKQYGEQMFASHSQSELALQPEI